MNLFHRFWSRDYLVAIIRNQEDFTRSYKNTKPILWHHDILSMTYIRWYLCSNMTEFRALYGCLEQNLPNSSFAYLLLLLGKSWFVATRSIPYERQRFQEFYPIPIVCPTFAVWRKTTTQLITTFVILLSWCDLAKCLKHFSTISNYLSELIKCNWMGKNIYFQVFIFSCVCITPFVTRSSKMIWKCKTLDFFRYPLVLLA